MRKQELDSYNEKIFQELKIKYPKLQLGFFNNNHILFVDQNTGNPFNNPTIQLTESALNKKTFKDFEYDYHTSLKGSRICKYLDGLVGKDWSHISFTNIVKIPTEDNLEPTQDMINEFLPILKKQISLLNPTLVILLGKFAGKQFGIEEFFKLTKINNQNYIMIEHHSNLSKLYDYENQIKNNKLKLNNLLKYYAIVKVTNYQVIYRDLEFNKCIYEHKEQCYYCYKKVDYKTPYKSYLGEYLDVVDKDNINDEDSYEKHLRGKDYFYYNNIDKISHAKMLRYLLFDIENDFCNDIFNPIKPVTSIVGHDNLLNKYTCWVLKYNPSQVITTKYKDAEIREFNNEVDMLKDFFKFTTNFDLLSGWYSEGFDIPYLINRAQMLNINLDNYFKCLKVINRDNKELMIYQQYHIFYDALKFYRMNVYYNKPPSYSLNSVAQFMFGDEFKKIQHDGVDKLWREDINKLIEYNIQDVYLLKKIVDAGNVINYPIQLQQICPQDFENVFFNSFTIENLLHHRYYKNNIFFPTKYEHNKPEYEGAVVLEPVPGTHQNVAAYDFSAMYTTIYLSMNFSPDTLIGEKKYVEDNFDLVKNDLLKRYPELIEKFSYNIEETLKQWILVKNDFGEYYFLPKDWKVGVLPALEQEMLNYRKQYTTLRDSYQPTDLEYKIHDELQGTFKTILNSIYGVAAFKKFILFNAIVPASITSVARQLNHWVQNQGKQNNLLSIYGDTDSIFIKFDNQLSFEEFNIKATEFNQQINLSFKDFARQFTSNDNVINNLKFKIDFEKAYSKLLLTDVKKRYFGKLKIYKGKILDEEKFSVTGFETRRDDTPVYFKKVLLELYDILLQENYKPKIIEYYKKIKQEIKLQQVEDLVIKIKLSNDVEEYKNLPIHLRALKNSGLEIKRGENVNMIYIKGESEVLHYDENTKQRFEIDYDKYLENFFVNKIKLIDETISVHPTLTQWMGC